jgi:hypothetical protein
MAGARYGQPAILFCREQRSLVVDIYVASLTEEQD